MSTTVMDSEDRRATLSEESPQLEVVLGTRHLAAIGFVAVAIVSLCVTVAYLAGRLSGVTQAASHAPRSRAIAVDAPVGAQRTVTPEAAVQRPPEAETKPSPLSPAPELPEPPESSQVAAPQAQPQPPANVAEATGLAALRPPVPGGYLQIAAGDFENLARLKASLMTKNIRCFLSPGPNPGEKLVRLLIGPLASEEEESKARAALRAEGLTPFLKRF
ncbi:MAG: SPOR domain-containing protein [Acidobacteria bacterium]|nr:SPOR domain-containing protein [Acidobacteriota bacterium]